MSGQASGRSSAPRSGLFLIARDWPRRHGSTAGSRVGGPCLLRNRPHPRNGSISRRRVSQLLTREAVAALLPSSLLRECVSCEMECLHDRIELALGRRPRGKGEVDVALTCPQESLGLLKRCSTAADANGRSGSKDVFPCCVTQPGPQLQDVGGHRQLSLRANAPRPTSHVCALRRGRGRDTSASRRPAAPDVFLADAAGLTLPFTYTLMGNRLHGRAGLGVVPLAHPDAPRSIATAQSTNR